MLTEQENYLVKGLHCMSVVKVSFIGLSHQQDVQSSQCQYFTSELSSADTDDVQILLCTPNIIWRHKEQIHTHAIIQHHNIFHLCRCIDVGIKRTTLPTAVWFSWCRAYKCVETLSVFLHLHFWRSRPFSVNDNIQTYSPFFAPTEVVACFAVVNAHCLSSLLKVGAFECFSASLQCEIDVRITYAYKTNSATSKLGLTLLP